MHSLPALNYALKQSSLDTQLEARAKIKGPPHRLSADYIQHIEGGRPLIPAPSDPKLGPGSYNSRCDQFSGPSCIFEIAPRFHWALNQYFLVPSSRQDVRKTRKRLLKRLNDNADVQRHNPLYQDFLVVSKGKELSLRLRRTQQNRKSLQEEKHRLLQEKIAVKQKRFEWKIRRYEVYLMRITWGSLFIVCQWVGLAQQKYLSKSSSIQKTRSLAKKFLFICRFLGKLKRVLHRCRYMRALITIQRLRGPVRKWIARKKAINRESVVDLLEVYCSHDMLAKLMHRWESSLVFLQRALRRLHHNRRTSVILKKLYWDKLERDAHSFPSNKRPRKHEKPPVKSSIPDEVKFFLIRKKLKEKLGLYTTQLRAHGKFCRKLTKHYRKTPNSAQLQFPRKPPRNYIFSTQDYRQMITEANQLRTEWDSFRHSN